MGTRGWELVTTDGPTAVAESLFYAIVVKNGEGDRSLAGTAGTSESIGNRCQFFGETDDPPDQVVRVRSKLLVVAAAIPRDARRKYKRMNPSIIQI
jgi:hypothetical protein